MRKYISQIASTRVKKVFRFLKYKAERKKYFREIGIKNEQDKIIASRYSRNQEKLIIFIVPGSDWLTGKDKISGGAISIVSICEESETIMKSYGWETLMCVMRDDHLFLRHTQFENNTWVYRFTQLEDYFGSVKEIILHLPEFMCSYFLDQLLPGDRKWLTSNKKLHINILGQNIRLMPDRDVIDLLGKLASRVTVTTAHQKYCNLQYREILGVPLHKFSVWISPEQYEFRDWSEKENRILVSPDQHPMKEAILSELAKISGLQVQIVNNLTYKEYKSLASRVKWSITFGEGLDGYLIEPVFSGAVAFAVYNSQFFTPDFENLATVYSSYEVMKELLVQDIVRLDNEQVFKDYQREQYNLCKKYYSKEEYKQNIRKFYLGDFTFV